jgi:two-component system cell cycle sensor histidine kinase/response regulator CckA
MTEHQVETAEDFAGRMAHDFNNLVAVILGHTNLIIDDLAEDDPIRAQLDEVRAAGERAGALTWQLLAFSRRHVPPPAVRPQAEDPPIAAAGGRGHGDVRQVPARILTT